MFPFFTSPLNDIQAQGQQMMLPNGQKQGENPPGINNMQQISPQFHAQNHQFRTPQMQTYNNQSMIMAPPSSACISNVPGMQLQNAHAFFNQHPQNINHLAALPFPNPIFNVSQVINHLGMQQLCGQLGQMQNMNQFYQFPRGGHLWPQNLPQNLNQVMGFQGQYSSQNLMPPQNQIQQSSHQAAGFTQIRPPSTVNGLQQNLSVAQNTASSSTACSTKVNDDRQNFPSDSVNPNQVSLGKNINNRFSACRNFKRNPNGSFNRDHSQRRFQKPNHHMANAKGIDGGYKQNGERAVPQFTKHGRKDPGEHRSKKSTALTYSEEEVRQWREARRKNFPSTANIQMKQEKVNGESQEVNEDTKLRRQQLKEILNKQMELGFEAAEVPSSYLFDLEREPPPRHGKRGRGADRWQHKKQRPRTGAAATVAAAPPPRKQTLLQRLLSSEIKRDASHLLQVFRFMTMNAFFDHWPGKSLKYPQLADGDGSDTAAAAVALTSELGMGEERTLESSESDCVTDGGGSVEEEEEGVRGHSVEQTDGVDGVASR